jgi:hypothetical protein
MIQDALIAHVNRICAPDADAFTRSVAEALCERAMGITHPSADDGVWDFIAETVQHFAGQIRKEREK